MGVIVAQERRPAAEPSFEPDGGAALLPVANRPLVAHALEDLRRAGVRESVVVTSRRLAPLIADALERTRRRSAHVEVVVADGTPGFVAALAVAAEFVGDHPAVAQVADGLLGQPLTRYASVVSGLRPDAVVLARRHAMTGHAAAPPARLLRLATFAPRAPGAGDAAAAGLCLFGPRALRCAGEVLRASRDPDVAELAEGLKAHGGRLHVRVVGGWRGYSGDAAELLALNRLVLDRLPAGPEPRVGDGVDVEGRVCVHPSARVRAATLRGPVVIGAGARVEDSYVGPYTAIGEGARVVNAEVEDSVLLTGAAVENVGVRLAGSVIGRNARVQRDFELPRAVRLHVGEGARVMLA